MALIEHARRELNLIKCDEPEKTALLKAVEGFATGGWSGGSVDWGIQTLVRLLQFQPLSDLSASPSEWVNVGDNVWQSRRRPTTFSRDGGRTWYDIDDESLNNGDVWKRDEGKWEAVLLGTNVQVGSRLRVREDAFTEGRLARLHNGRQGELAVVDNGLCLMRYDDGHEFRHAPANLEVLKTSV